MLLTINNLSKTYSNGTLALDNVTLEIPTGMFGLLGPNGAGKSSLMRTIATLQEPNSGTIFFDEIDVINNKMAVRQTLGYLPQEFGVYPKMSALDMLDHFATLKGISNSRERKETVKALLEQTNLYEVRKRQLGGYSGGMKQRFGIAQALLGNPSLIIVDEPTAGLDPSERHRFHNLLSEIGENVIVILSTHIVEDVSDLCSNMAIINRGQVIRTGNPNSLTDECKGKIWQTRIEKSQLPEYHEKHNVISSRLQGGAVIVRSSNESSPGTEFELVEPSLEDVYFDAINSNEQILTEG